MCPIIREHTKQEMSSAKEREQEDTIVEETNCYNNWLIAFTRQLIGWLVG